MNKTENHILLLVLLIMTVLSCRSEAADKGIVYAGEKTINVEIVYTNHDRAEGLMHRKKLDKDAGMIFVFPYDRKLSFWMKNTFISLSIAYIASDFTIKEIRKMKTESLKPVRSANSVRYALEVNQGYFEENNIKEGDKLVFSDSILQALEKAED